MVFTQCCTVVAMNCHICSKQVPGSVFKTDHFLGATIGICSMSDWLLPLSSVSGLEKDTLAVDITHKRVEALFHTL